MTKGEETDIQVVVVDGTTEKTGRLGEEGYAKRSERTCTQMEAWTFQTLPGSSG